MKLLIFCIGLALAFVGCKPTQSAISTSLPPDPQRRSWTNVSLLKTNLSIAKLSDIANDPNRTRLERGQAVCTLFANHIKPGMDYQKVQNILRDAKWLEQSEVSAQEVLQGWIPIDNFTNTPGILYLFKAKEEEFWTLWLSFDSRDFIDYSKVTKAEKVDWWSGERHEYGPGELNTIAFLTGRWKIIGNPRLIEFSIGFPEKIIRVEGTGYFEHFTMRGMTCYGKK